MKSFMEFVIVNGLEILAILIASISLFVSYRLSKKSNDTQERMLSLELNRERKSENDLKKANLIADFSIDNKQVRIVNKGKAKAENVKITINNTSPSKIADLISSEDYFEEIPSGTTEIFKTALDKDSIKVWDIELTWDDEISKGNSNKFKLRV